MELNEYLLNTLGQTFKPVTFSGEIPCIINRFLVKSVNRNQGVFNFEPLVNNGICATLPDDVKGVPLEELESNWRYFISQTAGNLYQNVFTHDLFTKDTDKYLYFLNGIYCNSEKEILVTVVNYNPIRVWFNGSLVMTSSNSYNITQIVFVVKLHKGLNTLLCERMAFSSDNKKYGITERENVITTIPVEFFHSQYCGEFFDEGLLTELKNSYIVIPDRVLLKSQKLKFIVLPRWFETWKPEKIRIEIRNVHDELVKNLKAYSGEEIQVDMEESVKGAFSIKVFGVENTKTSLDSYIYLGNFAQERLVMLKKAESILGPEHEIVKTMRNLVLIPDKCNKVAELAQDELYIPLLKNYFEFESMVTRAVSSGKDITNNGLHETFKNTVLLFLESEIDDGYIAYRVYLPMDYTREKTYPLVLEMEWGYAMSTIPRTARYIRRGEFDEAIIVTICARGDLNNDFINEIGYLNIIAQMMERHKIDRDRIYAIGMCTGTVKVFGLAIRKPDLFAAVVDIAGGLPRVNDMEYFRNMEHLTVYNLYLFEDAINIALTHQSLIGNPEKSKKYYYHYCTHGEVVGRYCSRGLLKALVNEVKEKYPKKLCFSTQEPVFNKSYWVYIDTIEDLNFKAKIEAEIASGRQIMVNVTNAREFTLLLGQKEMGLDANVEILINGNTYMAGIPERAKVNVKAGLSSFSLQVAALDREDFQRLYDAITVEEHLLGLKQVYIKKCVIVEPGKTINIGQGYQNLLFEVLQHPLKERLRDYVYKLAPEETISEAELGQSNFVIYVNPDDKSAIKAKILNFSGLRLEQNEISYEEKKLSGDYFALIKIINPFNEDKLAMIVTCNSGSAGDELLRFVYSFDVHPLFYSDAVIYNNGNYYSLRKET